MFQPIRFIQADILQSGIVQSLPSGSRSGNPGETGPDGQEIRSFYEDLTGRSVKSRKEVKVENSEFCADCQLQTSDPLHSHSTGHLLSLQTDSQLGRLPSYVIPESNRGYQLMLKTGWDEVTGGLGADGKGRKYPVKTVLKRDRIGLGGKSSPPRVTHFAPFDTAAVGQSKVASLRSTTKQKRAERRKELRQKQKEVDFRRQFSELEFP